MLEDKHVFSFLRFVLEEEKETYRHNPNPDSKEINENETKYRKKVNQIIEEIAKKEGLNIEDI